MRRSLAVLGMATGLALVPDMAAQSATAGAPSAATHPTGTVRTDTLWAQALGLRKALVVYLPPSYQQATDRRYPVLLYLHGLSGNERNWVDRADLARTMDSLVASGQPEAIVAMPDGDDSWYTTFAELPDLPACMADTTRKEPGASFCVPWPHYDDYVAYDVVRWIDTHYRTRADRAHRGIGGLSMGGYGAMALALAYPELFSAAASHSGVLSPRLIADSVGGGGGRYAIGLPALRRVAGGLWPSQRLAFGRDSVAWLTRDPAFLAQRALTRARAGGPPVPALAFDTGHDDPWVAQNRDFHASLDRLGVAHRFTEYPGTHSWAYWRTHLPESLTFLLARVTAP